MKSFTYAKTLWHEFWMWLVGSPSKEATCELPAHMEWESTKFVATDSVVNAVQPPEEPVYSYKVPQETIKPHVVNAVVTNNPRLTASMNDANQPKPVYDFQALAPATKKIWIYNASRMDHTVDHPMLGTVTIPGNTTPKRYSLWTSLPNVICNTNCSIDSNEISLSPSHGEYFVNDLLYPDTMGRDYDIKKVCSPTSIGRDLNVKGVFWSYNNPPLRHEVTAAVKRMAARYSMLLEQLGTKIVTGLESYEVKYRKFYRYFRVDMKYSVKDAKEQARWKVNADYAITPEHHYAAEYFKVTTVWHPVLHGNAFPTNFQE